VRDRLFRRRLKARILSLAGIRLVLTVVLFTSFVAVSSAWGNLPIADTKAVPAPLVQPTDEAERPPDPVREPPQTPLSAAVDSFPVGWTNLLNTTATGNSIEKTAGTDNAEDAIARSTNVITGGDGYVEFQLTSPGKAISIGLNNNRQAFYTFDMEFALSAIGGVNIIEVREAGVYITDTSYTAADVLRIEISGTHVLYKKNGLTFHTSTPTFTYPYRADAVLFGLGAKANNVLMTSPQGTEGPAPATNFHATSISASQASVAWNDNSSDELGFILERAISVNNQSPRDWILITTTGPNVTSFTDTGLTQSTLYYYRVRSFNANGESIDRSLPVLTPSPTPTPTPTPSPSPSPSPSPTASPTPSFEVTWSGRLNVTATGNTLEKTSGVEGNEDARGRSTNVIANGNGFVEFQLTAGKALNVGLNAGPQAIVRADIEFGLSAVGGANIVEVREGAIYRADTFYTATDTFRIEINGSQVFYKKNGVTFYTNAAPTLNYPFRADATLLGIGGRVANTMMSTAPQPAEPQPPSNLAALIISSSQINLSWTDNSSDESGFILERARTLNGGGLSNWDLVVTTGPNVTSYSDTGLLAQTVYHYRLRSFNANGESTNVQISDVLTPGGPTPTPTPTPSPSPSSDSFDVAWTGLVNTTATGNSIEKTGTQIADDGRAMSWNVVPNGNGFVEGRFTTSGLITLGLNSGSQAVTRADMEFALSANGGGIVEVRELGVFKADVSVSASDVLRIEIAGTQVLYKKNGVTFYTNTSPQLSYPFRGDANLVTPGVRAENVRMSHPLPSMMLLDQNRPGYAAALDSANFLSGEFPLVNLDNFSADHKTRIMLFVTDFDLQPGENIPSVIKAELRNSQGAVYNLPVEAAGKVRNAEWLTYIVVRLEQVVDVGDLSITLTLRGVPTNTALIKTRP
jgi:hypothetical protein